MITTGLDIGMLTTKAVVVRDEEIVGWGVAPTGDSSSQAAEAVFCQALKEAGLSREAVDAIISTGAGKQEVEFIQAHATEVVCAARGARFLDPKVRGVIDMGGESTRVVKLDEGGKILDFALNSKCAAGTGIFVDAMAKVMGVPVDEMGRLSLESTADVDINSTCVVFAESEVVSQVHRQTPKKDILRGIHKSIASRVYGMVSRMELEGGDMAIGGLSMNSGVIACLQEMMNAELTVPEAPQIVPALGAALVAADQVATE
jgi:predicted CoA-substrate-specific enzyme activase